MTEFHEVTDDRIADREMRDLLKNLRERGYVAAPHLQIIDGIADDIIVIRLHKRFNLDTDLTETVSAKQYIDDQYEAQQLWLATHPAASATA